MILTSKISRNKLDLKVAKYASAERTLEVGSYGSQAYSRFFTNKVGLDIRPGKGVDVVGSVYDLPFKDNEFDIVLCMVVLEHLEDPQKAILEMNRVLKPKGKILVSVPFMFPMHDTPNDFWRFTKYGLQLLFKDWDIVEISAETNIHETFAVILQRVGYQATFYLNKIMKVFIFALAALISKLPVMTKKIYGGIDRKTEEPEAFASSYFLVAQKRS
jgi:SAM-dependent methyltransferase